MWWAGAWTCWIGCCPSPRRAGQRWRRRWPTPTWRATTTRRTSPWQRSRSHLRWAAGKTAPSYTVCK
jgi:hypothetical protein